MNRGPGPRPFIIAEAGVCHDGALDKALRLVETAARAQADAVKFQFWSSSDRLAERRKAAEHLEVYQRYRMPVGWLDRLAEAAKASNMRFMTTAYLPEDLPIIAERVWAFKIASFEAQDWSFLGAHAAYGKQVFLSTGLVGGDYFTRLRAFAAAWNLDLTLLHCVSAYPVPADQLNLWAIREFRLDGFSDHSGIEAAGGWAVLAGAKDLEVHFRLEDTDPANPDAGRHALTPDGLATYILHADHAAMVMGTAHYGERRHIPAEDPMQRFVVRP